ncbi:MAG: ECF transporter S component [Oscillospiraceae bacterium]|nr:ECF transporter S component [Oscillospiraceae bacterium]
MKTNTKKLTTLAMLAAISIILVYLIHFPIFPSAAFLEYDPADIPIFIGTLMFGPWAGLILTVVASIIQGITVSAGSGVIGIIMHTLSTGSFVLVAGLIYSRKKTLPRAIVALAAGVLVMTTIMVLWNIIFTPIFMGAPRQVVLDMLFPVILPFNFIKAGVNGLITGVIYVSLSAILKKSKLGLDISL